MYGRINTDPAVFATPKARPKARSRVPPTKRDDDDVRDDRKSKLEFKQKSVDFATPKIHNAKPKIIHKEKLSTTGLLSRPTGSVPMAQVFPRPSPTPNTNKYNGVGTTENSFSSKNTWEEESLSSATTLTDTTILHTTANHINSTRGDISALMKENDFEELVASNTTLDTTNFFPGGSKRAAVGGGGVSPYNNANSSIAARHHHHHKDLTSDLDELTRSASALTLGSHSNLSHLSEPSLHLYGGDPSGIPRGHDMYSQHLQDKYQTHAQPGPAYRSGLETMPGGFQAASFGGGAIPGSSAVGPHHMNHGSYLTHHSTLPASSFSRQADFSSGYSGGGGGSGVGGLNFTNDLSQWQQQHQHQLHRQQMEVHQSGGIVNGSVGTLAPAPVGSILPSNDPTRLDAVKKAADNIISEKDNIIDRQKLKIMELERQTRDSEVEMHKTLLKRVQDDGESLNIKLQEAHYENASVKSQLTELLSARSKDLNELEKKLAASEYELSELKGSLDKEVVTKNRELKELENKLSERDGIVMEYKGKYGALKKSNEDLEKKVSTLERYLSDLPTADEHIRKHTEIRSLKEDKGKYKQRAQELERRLKETNKGLVSRDGLIESLEQSEKDLTDRIQQLQNERDSLAEEVCLLRSEGASIPEEDFVALEQDNRKLKGECDKAKKLLDAQHKRLQQAESQHQQEVVRLEERLAQDEGSVSALRGEVGEKEGQLRKLSQTVKELGSQNQDLLEQNIMLKDKVKEFENQHTGEVKKLERHLMKELAVCFAELQSLVQICVQCAEGQDPNISVLLGIRATSVSEFDVTEHQGDNLQSLKYRLTKVKELRTEVDKMREVLSNKYAEDMGENLNCTTQ